VALFVFRDASGSGFGTSFWIQGSTQIHIEEGVWTPYYSGKFSNFREMQNLAVKFRKALEDGVIQEGAEAFLFTDNQVMERAFYRGTSSSPELLEMVLDMKVLQCEFKVIWVAGTYIISQGTDGFSRGDLENRVTMGVPMLSFVPLHLDPFGQSTQVEPWIQPALADELSQIMLDPEGWFEQGHGTGQYIWTVAQAAASAALDQLCEAKLAQPQSSHIFVVPTMMTPTWQKHIGKLSDVVFTVKAGAGFWPADHHEPLTVAFIFPILSSRPRQLKYCDNV